MHFLGLAWPNTSVCYIPNAFHELSEHKRHVSRSFSSSKAMVLGFSFLLNDVSRVMVMVIGNTLLSHRDFLNHVSGAFTLSGTLIFRLNKKQ